MPAPRIPSLAPAVPASRVSRIGVGLLAVLVVTLLRLALDPVLGDQAPFLMHVIAVAVGTWLGGLEGGLAAAAASSLAVDYLFVPPRYTLKGRELDHASAVALFVVVAFGLVWQLSRWRRAEHALRVSEGRLRRLVDVSAQVVWVTQPDGAILEDSPSWRAFTGRTYAQCAGWNWLEAIHPEDRDRVTREWRAALESKEPYRPEFRLLHHSGEYRHMACNAAPVLDPDGTVQEWIGMFVDITQRKEAERALRESREDLNHAQALGKIGSWRLDLQRDELRWSEETHRIFGVPAGTPLKYERFLAAVHPDDRALVNAAWQRALEGQPYALDHRIVVNGDTRWVHERADLESDADGRLRSCFGSVQDITARKGMEEALRTQAERLRLQGTVIEHAHDAILLWDREGRITFWNAGAERLYGITAREALGREPHQLLATRSESVAEMEAALAATGAWQGELVHQRPDGTAVVVDSRQVLVPEVGRSGMTLEINRDVTDRVRAEQERQAALARVRLLLALSEALSAAPTPDRISALVLETAVPALGAVAGHVARLSADGQQIELLGTWGPGDHHAPCPARLPLTPPSPLGDAIREGVTVTVASREERAARYPHHPGCACCQSEALAAIPLRGHRIVGALSLSFRDASALEQRDRSFAALVARQAAQALERAELLVSERRAHADVQEAGRIKDEFLATLSHELRTPLNAILGWAELLAAECLDPDAQRRAVEVIRRNARAQAVLIEGVLDISRIVTGRFSLNLQEVDLEPLVIRAVDAVRLGAEAKGVELQLHLSPAKLLADPDRMQQVVWNLVSNAVRFTDKGGFVRVEVGQAGQHAEIVVSDSGMGIPLDFLPHVFERFTQADGSRTRRHGGLGLGLAIVRHIVELHGGTVAASSPGEGQGATFTVRLPLRTA